MSAYAIYKGSSSKELTKKEDKYLVVKDTITSHPNNNKQVLLVIFKATAMFVQ